MHLRESKYANRKLCSGKREMLISTKLPLGMMFSVLGHSNKTSYDINSLGALSGHY
jgi:hypothetical protein